MSGIVCICILAVGWVCVPLIWFSDVPRETRGCGGWGVWLVENSLSNYYEITEPEQKLNNLVSFLLNHKQDKIIVFFLTCACVDYFTKVFFYYLI